MMEFSNRLVLCFLVFAQLSACQDQDSTQVPSTGEKAANVLATTKLSSPIKADTSVSLPRTSAWKGKDRLLASRQHGLLLLDQNGEELQRVQGRFDLLDYRQRDEQSLVFTSFDRQQQRVMFSLLNAQGPYFSNPVYLPELDFAVEALCLFQDKQNNVQLFVVGEEGRGQQWLLTSPKQELGEAKLLRELSLPNTATSCAVDDTQEALYVNEEGVGVWHYAANAETDQQRTAVVLEAPLGLLKSADAVAANEGTVFVLSSDDKSISAFQFLNDKWDRQAEWFLNEVSAPESLSVLRDGQNIELSTRDDDHAQWRSATLSFRSIESSDAAIATVLATDQTEAVFAHGDAADDPAIWVHPTDKSLSRVIATDKKHGLIIYDLTGNRLQTLAGGDLNNVDVRQGFRFGENTFDIAVASNRTLNSLAVYRIAPGSGQVSELAQLETTLNDIYGLCLYSPKAGEVHAIPNDKDGRFVQYRLTEREKKLHAEVLREFKLDSQPEACVADDQTHQLYIGEEDVGVWTLSADPAQSPKIIPVIGVGDVLHEDVEGIGFYRGKTNSYLVVSSQGNDSYVVLDATAPFSVRGRFRVVLNAEQLIDGVSETDGLEVSSLNFGGPYQDGLLVLQDGRKRLPQGKQNFKYVAWRDIQTSLNLP